MENLNSIVGFIAGGSLIATLIVGVTKNWIKNTIMPRWGDLGIQAFLLIVATVISLAVYLWQKFVPGDIAVIVVGIAAGSNFIYQALYKAIYQKLIQGTLDKDGQ